MHGIDAARWRPGGSVWTVGGGDTHPDGSDIPEGRARNRRVEILIVTEDRSLLPEEQPAGAVKRRQPR